MKNLKLVVNNDIEKKIKEIFFVKKELQTILNLYARMVSNGTWKDYALSSGNKEISFDVFQRASDKPVLRIFAPVLSISAGKDIKFPSGSFLKF